MSAEVQESGGEKWKEQAEEICCTGGLYPMVDMNMLLINFLYALYHVEQTSDDGDKHAE